MSDAGRKMDVEDVLSSIRRLVSEEARTAVSETVPEEPKAEAKPTIDRPEKLVLTPAFRVANAVPPVAEEPPEEPFQAPMVEAEPEVQTSSDEIEAPFSDVEDFGTDAQSNEAAVTREPTEEASENDEIKPVDSDIQPVAPALSEDLEIAPVEELTVAREHPEELEPAAEINAPAPELNQPSNGYEEIDYTIDSDSYLDEESLHELVAQMVRSELQGELGDRITRNVRKLVRREIHRALASRDFE